MKSKPILFSAPMVRALLDGTKTQTRRIIKRPEQWQIEHDGHDCFCEDRNGDWHPVTDFCPYGKIGDELWVRETFGKKVRNFAGAPHESFVYRADKNDEVHCFCADGSTIPVKWTPSIHMPRWASRITLEITGVKVERLQDISEEDAKAEGVERHDDDGVAYYGPLHNGHVCPKYAFARLWECINGFDSWAANPWVWAISFRKLTT